MATAQLDTEAAADRIDEFLADDDAAAGTRKPGYFSPSEFVTYRNVPVFSEHVRKTTSGKTFEFNRNTLQAVCDCCNERIAATGDYAAIIIGHTPSAKAVSTGTPVQPAVGFMGPFRMGLVGVPGNQKSAILADLHIYRDKQSVIRDYPRRSVELRNTNGGDYSEMYLDPIALLGGEVPALDMGLLYSATDNGDDVLRYSVVSPGASNVFIPVADSVKSSDDASKSPINPEERSQTMADQNTIEQFMNAFRQSDLGVFLTGLMKKGEVDDNQDDSGKPEGEEKSYAADAAKGDEVDDKTKEDEAEKMKYSKREAEMQKQLDAQSKLIGSLQKSLETQIAKQVDRERYSKLSDLAEQFVVDVDEEMEALKYGKASDDEFNKQVTRIEKHYRPIMLDIEAPVPGGTERYAAGRGSVEKYSKEVSDKALAVCKSRIAAGQSADYATILEEVKAGKH